METELDYKDFETVEELIAEGFNPLKNNQNISGAPDIKSLIQKFQQQRKLHPFKPPNTS